MGSGIAWVARAYAVCFVPTLSHGWAAERTFGPAKGNTNLAPMSPATLPILVAGGKYPGRS